MRAQTPSPKSVPLGTTTAGAAWFAAARRELAHDELQEQQCRFGGLLVFGEVAQDAALLLAAEGRVGQDHVDAVPVADLAQREAQAVAADRSAATPARAAAGSSGQQVRQRLGLAAEDALMSAESAGPRPSCTASPGARTPRPESRRCRRPGRASSSPSFGFDDFDHEADDGARRVELARVAGGVAHLSQHGLVQMAEGVDLVAAGEVDAVDLVDHVAQQVAVDHPVDRAVEDRGDDIAPVAAVGALQAAQIGEQAGPLRCRRAASLRRC